MSERIYYVSDHHFFHELSLKRSRQSYFDSMEMMNQEMIYRHNQKVKDEDHVFLLGDVVVCKEAELEECLRETVDHLKGHLHLIVGNHDYKYMEESSFLKRFETIDEAKLIKDRDRWIQLFHYPILRWYRKNKGAFHIYGHLHDEQKGKETKWLRGEKYALNACVEINDFTPCTLEELIINNQRIKDIELDENMKKMLEVYRGE